MSAVIPPMAMATPARVRPWKQLRAEIVLTLCLLYTSDAADE